MTINSRLFFYLSIIFLINISNNIAQTKGYNFRREVTGITDTWHKIIISDDMYSKISSDFSDLRIIGFSANGDTIEAPYLLTKNAEGSVSKSLPFKIINESHNDKGYCYTFSFITETEINCINLHFDESNFDRLLSLEGSQNQQQWFSILDSYRIVSIKNSMTDYSFTTLHFPDSKYKFFKLTIPSKTKPILTSADITIEQKQIHNYRLYPNIKTITSNDLSKKNTTVDIQLANKVSIAFIKINVNNKFDFYRNITIDYLSDSTKLEKSWIKNYTVLHNGVLSSIDTNGFLIGDVVTDNLRLTIENGNNEPLSISGSIVKGHTYELQVRITKQGNYFLYYGNNNAPESNYDIQNFQDKIPSLLKELSLGNEENTSNFSESKIEPLFKNKIWLWVIMGTVMLIIGGFSVKMLTSSEKVNK
jgi:hypothetical protein